MDEVAGHGVAGLLGGCRTVCQGGGVATTIRLLGLRRSSATASTVPAPLGPKAWALLAYLLLSGRAPGADSRSSVRRRRTAGRAALEPAALRRALGDAVTIAGDPLRLQLAPDVTVDARERARSSCSRMEFGASPAFEAWLRVMRRRVAGHAAAVLHETALAELAAGHAAQAAE